MLVLSPFCLHCRLCNHQKSHNDNENKSGSQGAQDKHNGT